MVEKEVLLPSIVLQSRVFIPLECLLIWVKKTGCVQDNSDTLIEGKFMGYTLLCGWLVVGFRNVLVGTILCRVGLYWGVNSWAVAVHVYLALIFHRHHFNPIKIACTLCVMDINW